MACDKDLAVVHSTEAFGDPLFAYTDETGNTGLNVFDIAQPVFWTGTLLSLIDLDKLDPSVQAYFASRAGTSELHGSVLGVGGIEKIARAALRFLRCYKAHFIFTRIEKRHFAATKFADTVLDSGLNKAVSNLHYGVKVTRIYLAYVLTALIQEDELKRFWAIYDHRDATGFSELLDTIGLRIAGMVYDYRTRELLLDAIKWGSEHPADLLDGPLTHLSSPNVAALGLLVRGLHDLYRQGAGYISSFVYDEQQQFGPHLRKAFNLTTRHASRDQDDPLAFMTDLEELRTFVCSFDSKKSEKSLGLQLLDVSLWILKRSVEGPRAAFGHSLDLLTYLIDNSVIYDFSQKTMTKEVERSWSQLMSIPVTPAQSALGAEWQQKLERARIERMRSDNVESRLQ